MIKRTMQISAALLLALLAGATTAQEDFAELDALLSGIQTLSAEVTQLIIESDGGILEESQIRMQLKKPDGFYWETLSPFPELIVTNGKLLWNYQPDLEQVVIEDWDTSRSELAAQLLNGQTQNLAMEYAISSATETGSDDAVFKLIPLADESEYRDISISFINAELDMIHLHGKNGQQTVWQFNELRRNIVLEDNLFEFIPPAGVEVIQNSYVN